MIYDLLQTELLSPPRAIQTAEELLLVIRILESQDRWAEVVQVLNSENAGLSSRIVNNDRTFMSSKVTSLGAAGLWEEGHSYAKSLLTVSEDEAERSTLHERDDWKYWNLLIAAVRHLDNIPGYVLQYFTSAPLNPQLTMIACFVGYFPTRSSISRSSSNSAQSPAMRTLLSWT